MKTRYFIGSNEFSTREAAVRKAREYANDEGQPVRVTVEKERSTHYSRTKARVLGPSAPDVSYSDFEVRPTKRNPRVRFRILESYYDQQSNKTRAHIEQGGVRQWFEVSGRVSKAALPGLLKYSVEKYFTNPAGSKGKFARCVKAVSKRGGAYDPRAVCGAMEKKYRGNPPKRFYHDVDARGRERFYHDSNVGRRMVLYPTEEAKLLIATGQATVTPKTSKSYAKHNAGWEFGSKPYRPPKGIRLTEQIDAINARMAKVGIMSPQWKTLQRRKEALLKMASAEFKGNPTVIVSPNERRAGKWKVGPAGEPARYSNKTKAGAIAWAKRYVKEYGGEVQVRENPAAGAVAAYEEFHGRNPDEFVTVKRSIHIHRHLAGAGQLRMLKVQAVDGKSIVKLTRFGNALLAFNEAKNQLFIEGGSQSVDLKAFGIRTQHEVETLGKVIMLDYFTRKDHLGEEGGTAIYRHKFRTVNEDGRPVTVKILRYPDLIYFVRDKHLVFSGGDYEILAEGIDK